LKMPAVESYHHAHEVELTAGHTYSIEMHAQFDTFLRVEEGGQIIAENDDIDPRTDRNSRVVLEPARTGKYRVIATSFEPRTTGEYTVAVRQHETIFPKRDFGIESDAQSDSGADDADGKKKGAAGAGVGISTTSIIVGAVIVGLIILVALILIVRSRSDS